MTRRITLALIGIALLAAAISAFSILERDPNLAFAGSWEAIDSDEEGSIIHITIEPRRIAGDLLFNFRYRDNISGACEMGPSAAWDVHTFAEGYVLFVQGVWSCPDLSTYANIDLWHFWYQPETDTMLWGGEGGMEFHRVESH